MSLHRRERRTLGSILCEPPLSAASAFETPLNDVTINI
jgi:hypothetical protein